MASLSRRLKSRRRMRLAKAGRARKNLLSRKSTLSYQEMFAACGEPGKPAPAQPTSAE